MKLVFIVISDTSVIMGVFSNIENAKACKKHYEYRCLESTFRIETEYIDMLTAEDYEK